MIDAIKEALLSDAWQTMAIILLIIAVAFITGGDDEAV